VDGIGLVVNQPIADGSHLQMELTNTVSGTNCVLWLRVLHARTDGTNWTLGGAFLEKLTTQDLLTLLA
jgi:hypothetical protein